MHVQNHESKAAKAHKKVKAQEQGLKFVQIP